MRLALLALVSAQAEQGEWLAKEDRAWRIAYPQYDNISLMGDIVQTGADRYLRRWSTGELLPVV